MIYITPCWCVKKPIIYQTQLLILTNPKMGIVNFGSSDPQVRLRLVQSGAKIEQLTSVLAKRGLVVIVFMD